MIAAPVQQQDRLALFPQIMLQLLDQARAENSGPPCIFSHIDHFYLRQLRVAVSLF